MLLHLPPSWPSWAVWCVFAAALAGLDLALAFIGAMVVRTRGEDLMVVWGAAGAAVAILLFWVISSSLVYGDMVQMNVLWIAALLALVPFVNAAQGGDLPSLRVVVGLAGMIFFVAVIQWPQPGPGAERPRAVAAAEQVASR